MSTPTTTVRVWDPIVRIGHWTLVIAFFTAYFTEDDFMTQHVWAGYVIAAVISIRIIWGIIGSKHARFSDFIYRPRAVLDYLKGLIQRKPQHYLGHNPAGGAMVIALLFSLCITVYSGLALYAVEKNAGPLANIYGDHSAPLTLKSAPANALVSNANASENESDESEENEAQEHQSTNGMLKQNGGKEGFGGTGHSVYNGKHASKNEQTEEFWEGLHEFFANFTLLLVILHVGGVILSSRIDKENLVKAMITGRKDIVKY
ncbi:MAG: cytochrome b/b6 domain-containing protein [Methylophilus sp.]